VECLEAGILADEDILADDVPRPEGPSGLSDRGLGICKKQVCVQPCTSAVNVTLPTSAAKRHAVVPLLMMVPGASTRWPKKVAQV